MRIPWVQLEPMFFIFGALERILHMPSASPQHPVSRHVMQECRQWERELTKAIDLAYGFCGTVPMVAHAILPLKSAMDSSREQVAGNDVDNSRSKIATDIEPAYSLWGMVSMVAHTVLPQKLTADSGRKQTASDNSVRSKPAVVSSKPAAASVETALRGTPAARSSEPASTDIDKAVVLLPQMCTELQYSFRGPYRDEVAALLLTPGYTSCAFVSSANDDLLGAAIIDKTENHICYVLAFGMPGRAVSETVVRMLRAGKVTLHDATNDENKQFWPGLGFEMNTNRRKNPEQSPKEMIATQDVVLNKINEKWTQSTKRWVEGTDFRVLKFELSESDLQALHHKVFDCSARSNAAADKLKNKWIAKSVCHSAYWR